MKRYHEGMSNAELAAFNAEQERLDKTYADAAAADERRDREYRAAWEARSRPGICAECHASGPVEDGYCFTCGLPEDPHDFMRGALDHRGRP